MKKIIELDQYESFQPYVAEVKPLTPEQLQIDTCLLEQSYSQEVF